MRRLQLAVIGRGALGTACAQALQGDPQLQLAGVVRSPGDAGDAGEASDAAGAAGAAGADEAGEAGQARALPAGCRTAGHVSELGQVDVALVCVGSAAAPGVARELLQAQLPLVEGAQLEGAAAREHEATLHRLAQRHRVAAVIGAHWSPGVAGQLRRLFELLIPDGRTRVAHRVAAGLHHTAAAEGVAGVRAALCQELHDSGGARHRYVYVELEPKAELEPVRQAIQADPLFAGEPTEVLAVPQVRALGQASHGLLLERAGGAGHGPHASLVLEARLDEAEFNARLMLDAARALPMHPPGGWRYTPWGLVPVR